ncbi:hypothetical protein B0H10DRAFT_1950774 [Mycena sp. CBHHK59/15]|nr:hypothetical protein B0H10DRAFT_1950774 [Mycena sp. CBHHK59/15]
MDSAFVTEAQHAEFLQLQPRSVGELSAIPSSIQVILPWFTFVFPDSRLYSRQVGGVLAFMKENLAPFARIINLALPSRASKPSDVPEITKVYLNRFVGCYLRYAALTYIVALEVVETIGGPMSVPVECVISLSLMSKFHSLLDSPSYGMGPAYEGALLRRVQHCLRLARSSRNKASDPIDVPITLDLAPFSAVPSWTAEEIAILHAQERVDPWIGEKYWLRERIQDAEGMVSAPTSSLPAFLPMTDPALVISSVLLNELHPILPIASSERIKSSLDILWVSHIRCLAQALHEVLGSRQAESLPADVLGRLRGGLKVLLSNMILLGSTKVGAVGNAGMVEYYIPGTATMTFAMAECFVEWFGYTGDDLADDRNGLFDALAVLQSHMILRPDYIHHGIDAHGFSLNTISPSTYGVGQRTKADQVHQAREGVLHKFGARLRRYHPELGDVCYKIPVVPADEMFIPTRSNTPDDDIPVGQDAGR